MSQKPETRFRVGKVKPFLKTLKHTYAFPIQQLAIIGDPDFLLCVRGLFVALELKDDDKKPRALQRRKGDEVERCQGIYFVATPSNWKEVKEQLTNLDGGIR